MRFLALLKWQAVEEKKKRKLLLVFITYAINITYARLSLVNISMAS